MLNTILFSALPSTEIKCKQDKEAGHNIVFFAIFTILSTIHNPGVVQKMSYFSVLLLSCYVMLVFFNIMYMSKVNKDTSNTFSVDMCLTCHIQRDKLSKQVMRVIY